jgi:hypothetical protein
VEQQIAFRKGKGKKVRQVWGKYFLPEMFSSIFIALNFVPERKCTQENVCAQITTIVLYVAVGP